MNVLLLNQCFYPDVMATAQHLTDLAVGLARKGHEVTVVASDIGVAVHSLVDFGLHMIVNAQVFTTLVMIATSNPHWASPKDL